jgi:hypothetical protein
MTEQNKQQETQQATEAPRKPFVKPEVHREAKLPEITNSFVGSYDP